jgi:hypothetical protein
MSGRTYPSNERRVSMGAFGDRDRRTTVEIPEVVKGDRRVKKASAAYERVVAELAAAKDVLGQLYAEREQAEHARLEREAQALVRGASADASGERDFEPEIASAQRRLETCERGLELAQVELCEAFDRHRSALVAAAGERIESAKAAYASALAELNAPAAPSGPSGASSSGCGSFRTRARERCPRATCQFGGSSAN